MKHLLLALMVVYMTVSEAKEKCPDGFEMNVSNCMTTLAYCPTWTDEKGNFTGGDCNQTTCEVVCS